MTRVVALYADDRQSALREAAGRTGPHGAQSDDCDVCIEPNWPHLLFHFV